MTTALVINNHSFQTTDTTTTSSSSTSTTNSSTISSSVVHSQTKLVINTGNVLPQTALLFRFLSSPSSFVRAQEELFNSVTSALTQWHSQDSFHSNTNTAESNVIHIDARPQAFPLNDTFISVKLFVFDDITPQELSQAIQEVLTHLRTEKIDTFLLAPQLSSSSRYPSEFVDSIWETVESFSADGTFKNIGVCNFNVTELEAFYSKVKITPSINQIPSSMVNSSLNTFAETHKIKLLSNPDTAPEPLISQESLQSLLAPHFAIETGKSWTPKWVARYSTEVKCRNLVTQRGYILGAELN